MITPTHPADMSREELRFQLVLHVLAMGALMQEIGLDHFTFDHAEDRRRRNEPGQSKGVVVQHRNGISSFTLEF